MTFRVELSKTLSFILFSFLPSPSPSPSSSSLSTKDIESRSESLGLFDTLKCNPEAFYRHMTKYVLPTVEGTDQARLLYYYTLLDAAGCEPFVTTIIKPESHVKLLKKLRAVASGETVVFPYQMKCRWCYDVMSFVCSQHLHHVIQVVTDPVFVLTAEVLLSETVALTVSTIKIRWRFKMIIG